MAKKFTIKYTVPYYICGMRENSLSTSPWYPLLLFSTWPHALSLSHSFSLLYSLHTPPTKTQHVRTLRTTSLLSRSSTRIYWQTRHRQMGRWVWCDDRLNFTREPSWCDPCAPWRAFQSAASLPSRPAATGSRSVPSSRGGWPDHERNQNPKQPNQKNTTKQVR